MHVDDAIRQRRTHKVFSGAPIDDETLRTLCELATWAPNHRFTEPWRFAVVRGPRLADMAVAADASLASLGKDGDAESLRRLEGKRDKLRRRLAQVGAVIVASHRRSPDDAVQQREDYAATACAVQNLLLAATARGLVGLWSTGAVLTTPPMRVFYGVPDDHDVVAVVFLGRPTQALEGHRYRTPAEVVHFV